jgi:hypothetical protein
MSPQPARADGPRLALFSACDPGFDGKGKPAVILTFRGKEETLEIAIPLWQATLLVGSVALSAAWHDLNQHQDN